MKSVKEIAVHLQNRPGALSEISDLLGANGINILGLTVRAENAEGTLNFIATDPSKVINILESAGFKPVFKEILAAEAPHHPGGLNAILKPLKLAGVNIEYLYTCIGYHGVGDRTVILLAVDKLKEGHEALTKDWIRLFGEELYNF